MSELKLIGAGLPRTATLTQKIALETLGFKPCYHMVEVLENLALMPSWAAALAGRVDWDEIFSGYAASVDWPGAYFYEELMEKYPNAKVLLSVRDSDAWACSIKATMWDLFYGDTLMHDLSNARGKVEPHWQTYIELMKGMWQSAVQLSSAEVDLEARTLALAMERYNEQVIATVPADRLLVWSAVDGWDPLCAFLGVPVPETPFPHVNDSAGFADMLNGAAMASLNEWQAQQAPSAQG